MSSEQKPEVPEIAEDNIRRGQLASARELARRLVVVNCHLHEMQQRTLEAEGLLAQLRSVFASVNELTVSGRRLPDSSTPEWAKGPTG